MANVAISGDTSGAITLSAPAVAGTNTITLPASTGTMLTTGSPQSGGVIQVVQSTYNVNTSNATGTYIDTGLSASITPKFSTSKILILVTQAGCGKVTNNTGVDLQLLRNGSTIYQIASGLGVNAQTSTTNRFFNIPGMYLDSPATTSSTTYKTQFASSSGNSQVNVQDYATSLVVSTITLMEIAA
jgi:hypothetical protein